jgi:hypothetical protein
MAWMLLAVLAVCVRLVIGMFNSLGRLKVRSGNTWSDIDVQRKRRYDLIPNLVETVKGYAGHENESSTHPGCSRRSCPSPGVRCRTKFGPRVRRHLHTAARLVSRIEQCAVEWPWRDDSQQP